MTMIDENTVVLMDQLRNLQSTANTCAYVLMAMSFMLAAILWRIW
jgi:hypothetical protein